MRHTIIILLLSLNFMANAHNPIKSRKAQFDKILSVTAQHFCNPNLLRSPEWQDFVQTMQSNEVLALSEQEFVKVFNREVEKLPFTHYYLRYTGKKKKKTTSTANPLPAFAFKPLDSETALVTIRRWAADAKTMSLIVDKIENGVFKNLIIDLRDNRGGTLDAAVVLGQYLTQEPIDIGTFITKNWFKTNTNYPNNEQLKSFPFLTDMTYQGFGAMLDKPAFRMVVPGHANRTFKGKVYVLTNSLTASTCEPLVNVVKKQGLATLIGEPTAGAMMSANYVKIDKRLKLFIPHSDFVDSDGFRIDKVGVAPDIVVVSQDALSTAISLIDKQ